MITGTTKKNVAIWRCQECGAEQPIVQVMWVPGYGEHIDMDETIAKRELFFAQHALCKKEIIQTELSFNK